jgi:hypothetical protein
MTTEIKSVERIAACDPAEFVRSYIEPSRPVILTGVLREWPALRRWSLGRLAADFGDRVVTVGETEAGRLVVDRSGGVAQREIPLRDFIDRLQSGNSDYYLLSSLDERLPELLEDLRFEAIGPKASWRSLRMWISAPDTCAGLHHDLPENFLAQVMGRKRVILIHRLEPGEILYIPRLWWHQIRSLDLSMSVNQWFASGPLALAARGAQLFARVRGLRH